MKYFPDFMNQVDTEFYIYEISLSVSWQEVSRYQEKMDEDPSQRDERPRRDYTRVTIEKVNGSYFLIGEDIFNLSAGIVLTTEMVKELPFQINYTGPPIHYKTNQEEAFAILLRIISNANKMQDPRFVSFPVGKC